MRSQVHCYGFRLTPWASLLIVGLVLFDGCMVFHCTGGSFLIHHALVSTTFFLF